MVVLLHHRKSIFPWASQEAPEELEGRAEVESHADVGSVEQQPGHGQVEGVEEHLLPGLHQVTAGDQLELAEEPVQIARGAPLHIHPRLPKLPVG